jgi:type IV pilus assembly protein PilX
MFAHPVENNHFQTPPPSRQEGVVLVVGMILLIMITLYALASIRGIAGQEHIAGNLYDRELAFTAAESVLRYAEERLTFATLTTASPRPDSDFETGDLSALQGYITPVPGLRPAGVPVGHDPGYAVYQVGVAGAGTGNIDCNEDITGTTVYKINAVGIGRNPASIVVLQSIVCK